MLKIILIKVFMLSSKEKIHISKKLSLVLRHKASHYGLQISQDGYVKVSDLLSLHLFKNLTFEDLKNIVDTNDKKRFQLIEKEKYYYIRANQGHSIKDVKTESLLTQLHEPVPLIHGTFQKNIQSIKENGLKKMSIVFLIAYSIFIIKNISRLNKEFSYKENEHHNFKNFPFFAIRNKEYENKNFETGLTIYSSHHCWDTPSPCGTFDEKINVFSKNGYYFIERLK